MDVLEAIKGRRSIRAFLDKPIAQDDIETILNTARWAPSGVNTQPWNVYVLQGQIIQTLGQTISTALEQGIEPAPDYHYYPNRWFEPYKSRRKACGLQLYSSISIDFQDVENRKKQWYRNYYFFGAPVGFLLYIDKNLETGSYMDSALFLQNIMLAARGLGLETCAQASFAEHPTIIRDLLGISDDKTLLCGVALGYADWEHPINSYRTPRENLEEFVQFV